MMRMWLRPVPTFYSLSKVKFQQQCGEIFLKSRKIHRNVPVHKMPENKKKSEDNSALKEVGWFALKTVGISAAVLGGVAVAVPAIGFTAGGVAAGSLAASFQGAFLGGTIASGSAFAVLQSVGAAGLAASTQAAVVAASAATAGVHTVIKKIRKKKKANEPNSNSDESTDNSDDDDDPNASESASKNLNNQPTNNIATDNVLVDVSTDNQANDKICTVNGNDFGKQNNQSGNVKGEKEDAGYYGTELKAMESKWKDVQLTDDVTITQKFKKK